MHPNPTFRKTSTDKNITFVRDRSFGTLSINGKPGPIMAHIPFLLSPEGTYIEAHLVRSNPIYRALTEPQNAVISVMGGDGYISPDWYGVHDQVPTWNYVAVQIRGVLKPLPETDLRGVLERLSEAMEARLSPKPIWKIDKVSEDALAKLMRQIVPVAFDVEDIDSTWKLGQNKAEQVRLDASEALLNDGFGLGYHQIADHMKYPPA